jgi:thiamine pyrophosphokinase
MRIVIIANGEPPTEADVNDWLQPNTMLMCADGGAKAALRFGLRPQHAIGDFDSLNEIEIQQLEALGTRLHRHSAAKDETDLELALMFATQLMQAPGEIVVLGAMGGRIDHELANIMLLAMPCLQGHRVVIAHGADQLCLIDARREPSQITLHGEVGDVVSMLPFGGDAQGIRTDGLQYPLHDEPLLFGPARGVSNVMASESASVRVQAGMLLCVVTRKGATHWR